GRGLQAPYSDSGRVSANLARRDNQFQYPGGRTRIGLPVVARRAQRAGCNKLYSDHSNALAGAQGNYFVVVSNFAGSVTSAIATLSFDASALKILVPPKAATAETGYS